MSNHILDTKPLHILLVEDDDVDAKAVMRAFAKAKIANPIIRASNGVEALEILRGNNKHISLQKPYIMLVDINMPRMGGIQLVKALRGDETLKQAIVFILTTSDAEQDKISAYDLNVAGYILKETAGQDFLQLVTLIDNYWKIVELPS